ncbi:MAG: ABC transporter permease [Oscillospiraceae bacterium]|nr:ABC transporter permease [Oscillospiraceae bacterium]
MKSKIALKTLYRSPVKTALTFILLAAVTFALFSQVLEYVVASRETERAVAEYIGTGSVEVEPPYAPSISTSEPSYAYSDPRVPLETWGDKARVFRELYPYKRLTQEQIDEILALPYVSDADFRYMTAGVSEDYYRMPEDSEWWQFDFARNCVIVGTVAEITETMGVHSKTKEEIPEYKTLILEDVEILAGNPNCGEEMEIQLHSKDLFIDPDDIFWDEHYISEDRSEVFLVKTTYFLFPTREELYGPEVVGNLNVGDRYVFITRYNAYEETYDGVFDFHLTDSFLDTMPGIYNVTDEPEGFLDTEKYAELKEYINMVNTDIHTFDVVYTKDMESIRFFADETMQIVDGRSIRPSDAGKEICVISVEMAEEFGLAVGDTLTLKLGDKLFEQYLNRGAVAVVPECVSDSYTEVTLEIVGTYIDVRGEWLANDDPHWSYSYNALFVPSTLLNVPESELENHTFAPGEFSFIVGNTWDIEAFLLTGAPKIEEMGLTLFFNEGNWMEIVEVFEGTQRVSEIKIAVLLVAVIVASCFVAFLYIVGRKRDFAIMRLLGTSVRKSGWSLVLPLCVVAVAAAALGCGLAVMNTMQNLASNETLAQITEIEVNTNIPIGAIIGCFAGEIMLVLAVSLIMLAVLGKRPPLVLVQTGAQRKETKKKIKQHAAFVPEPEKVVLGEWVSIEPVVRDGKKRHASFVFKYIKRHISRSKSKALMFILVTALLLNVAGQMNIMKESYERLLTETKITSNYVDGMNLSYVFRLKDSGYVKDVYYYSVGRLEVEGDYAISYITTDMERSVELPFEITWLDGFSEADMQHTKTGVMVVGQLLMEERGWELGQTVLVTEAGVYAEIQDEAFAKYEEENGVPDLDNMTDAEKKQYMKEKIAATEDEVYAEYATKADEFVIIGVSRAITEITPMAEALDESLFTPGLEVLKQGYGKLVMPMIIEATLADNTLAEEYRAYGEELAASTKANTTFVMDTSKLENLRNNISLMEALVPIITIAVMVIGAFLCGLIIVQTSKDIAIMRVLGTSKRKTRTIIVLEQMVLCIVGTVIAIVVLALRGAFVQMMWVFGAYVLVIILASVIAAAAASSKNVLELLQTRE